MAICSFSDKRIERAFRLDDYRKVPPPLHRRVHAALADLDQAQSLQDLALPRYRLHPLTADHAGFYSIRVGRMDRLIFRFVDSNAHNVRLIDYH